MNQQMTNINSENTTFKIIMCIFIMIIGASLIICGFFYFTINETIKINAIIIGLDLTTSTATASYTLNSQPYSIEVDSSNLNINDTLAIWVRKNNPNIVFLNNQSSENPGILLMIFGSCILFFSLIYCSIKYSNYTFLPIGSPSPPVSSHIISPSHLQPPVIPSLPLNKVIPSPPLNKVIPSPPLNKVIPSPPLNKVIPTLSINKVIPTNLNKYTSKKLF